MCVSNWPPPMLWIDQLSYVMLGCVVVGCCVDGLVWGWAIDEQVDWIKDINYAYAYVREISRNLIQVLICFFGLFWYFTYERKRHCSVNRMFSAPLVCCSIATVLLSLCRIAQFVPCCSVCAVLLICAVLLSLCNICAQETLSNELWPSLGNICSHSAIT